MFLFAQKTTLPAINVCVSVISSSRYSIDKRSDTTKAFKIDPNNGTITVAKALDRETENWHNVTVAAKETSKEHLVHTANLWLTQLRKSAQKYSQQCTEDK